MQVPVITTENLTMRNPDYQGYNKDGSRYVVRAATAAQDLARTKPVDLTVIEARLLQPDNTLTVMRSPRGTYDDKTGVLELYERIDIDGENGVRGRLTRATIYSKDGRVVSNEPVMFEMPTGRVRSNAMVLQQKTRQVSFTQGVATRLIPPQKPETSPKADAVAPLAPPARATAAAGPRLLSNNGAPVDVTALTLDVDDLKKIAVFRGDVRAVQGEAQLATPELEVTYEGQPVAAPGAAPVVKSAAAPAQQGRVKTLIARDGVVLTRGVDTARARNGEFNGETETAVLTGGVLLTSANGRQATGDRADVDLKTERSRLTGNVVILGGPEQRANADVADLDQREDTALLTGQQVVISQGRNTLRGRRLFIDRKAGITDLTTPGAGGRIAAVFYRSDAAPAPGAAKSADKKPAAAAAGEGGLLTIKSDPNAPINIDAESLKGNDTAKTATFRGEVKVVQGEFTLRTPELVVSYTGSAALADAGKAADGPREATQVKKIRANKKVVITTAQNQEVVGDWAEFDIASNTTVVGVDDLANSNVVVTQGGNRIYGPKVIIDMTTGEARWDQTVRQPIVALPTVAATPVKPPGIPVPGTATKDETLAAIARIAKGNCGGRQCLVVFPNQVKEQAKARVKEFVPDIDERAKEAEAVLKRLQTKRSSSSWEPVTTPKPPTAKTGTE
jgi:LPS export ABC transporter protein LptC